MKFVMPTVERLDRATLMRVLAATRDAVEKWDLNDGVETATGTKKHRLGGTPSYVVIQVSDDPKFGSYTQINPDSVGPTEITYTTAKAYVKVLAEK